MLLPSELNLSEGGPFRSFDLDSADDFLHWLSSEGTLFRTFNHAELESWVFRGIGNVEFGLVPSACRLGAKLLTGDVGGGVVGRPLRTEDDPSRPVTNRQSLFPRAS